VQVRVGEKRVDDLAGVVDEHVAQDAEETGVRVDLDDAGDHAVRPGRVGREATLLLRLVVDVPDLRLSTNMVYGESHSGDGAAPHESWRSSCLLDHVAENLVGDALAGLDRPIEVTLEIERGVLAAEVAVAGLRVWFALTLDAGELRVLADLPVGV
jgi:hypothetical protein